MNTAKQLIDRVMHGVSPVKVVSESVPKIVPLPVAWKDMKSEVKRAISAARKKYPDADIDEPIVILYVKEGVEKLLKKVTAFYRKKTLEQIEMDKEEDFFVGDKRIKFKKVYPQWTKALDKLAIAVRNLTL